MSERKLVSVVTGTWRRHKLLFEAIQNVREQTYRPLEHVIVSDGPDRELRRLVKMANAEQVERAAEYRVPIRFVELGHNTSTRLTNSMSAVPFGTAVWLARGEYILWLADDERMTPDHVESMVNLLEDRGVDFVYPKTEFWYKHRPEKRWVLGTQPPQEGTITHVLHRWDLLNIPEGQFRPHVGKANDWYQISHWLEAGATCAMLDRVTFSHRIDS